jgi:hypothetical protein
MLALKQLTALYLPSGVPILNDSVLVNAMSEKSKSICENIIIRTTAHTSIRWCWILIIIGWASITTLILFLEQTSWILFKLVELCKQYFRGRMPILNTKRQFLSMFGRVLANQEARPYLGALGPGSELRAGLARQQRRGIAD